MNYPTDNAGRAVYCFILELLQRHKDLTDENCKRLENYKKKFPNVVKVAESDYYKVNRIRIKMARIKFFEPTKNSYIEFLRSL
jgi:hypothetical protein